MSKAFRLSLKTEYETHCCVCGSVAQKVVGERFGPDKIERVDMLGSFIRHGVKQRQAESEVLLQM